MVQSGGSLVSHPSEVKNANSSYGNGKEDEDDHDHDTNSEASNAYEVIPGLDGSLYSYTVSEKLHQLPVTIQDIIDNGPISTCMDREDGKEGEEACGLVMGQSSSKLIALDPLRGTVQWMHQTSVNANFNGQQQRKTKTVLLQRDDYNIKHVDAETGVEGWRVHLGAVKALDLPKKKSSKPKPNPALFRIRPGVDIDGDVKRENDSPKIDGFKETPLLFEQRFPSVAFGSDGLTLHTVDELQNILWVRHFDSTIASVYGVGENMNWVDLEVMELDIDEEKEDEDGANHSNGRVTSGLLGGKEDYDSNANLDMEHAVVLASAPAELSIGGPQMLTPIPLVKSQNEDMLRLPSRDSLVDGICESSDHAFLGKHRSSLFVATTTTARKSNQLSDISSSQIEYYEDDDNYDDDDDGYEIRQEDMTILNEMIKKYQGMQKSRKTPHGLFLTWKLVATLACCIISGFAGGRFLYLRKKRKWIIQNSPAIVPSTSGVYTTSGGQVGDLVPLLRLERAKTAVSPLALSSSRSPYHRSRSLSDIEFYSKESRASKDGFSLGQSKLNYMSGEGSMIGTKTLKAGTPSMFNTKTITTESLSPKIPFAEPNRPDADEASQRSPSMETVSNFEGIPLVRYSRYSSEFNELSPLGKGGFGTVFKCTNALDGREYAVKKVLIRSHLDSNGYLPAKFAIKLERVLREVKILALLDHVNIVRYYTAWLEVEEEEAGYTTSKSALCRGMSSDFLAGANTFDEASNSAFISKSTSPDRRKYHNVERNPLGWNTFGTDFDELSFDSRSVKGKDLRLRKKLSSSSIKSEEDLGFTFERAASGSSRALTKHGIQSGNRESLATIHDSDVVDNVSSDSSSSGGDSSSSSSSSKSNSSVQWSVNNDDETLTNGRDATVGSSQDIKTVASESQSVIRYQKHILYIQMQLSQKTLLDYFQTRDNNLDIPFSLRMFGHIVRGVKNVHKMGLIHRDLKPSNCFMDDSDVVKIGDFGLSRESGAQSGDDVEEVEIKTTNTGDLGYHHDNTAGVGTSSYASPEQMIGSDYDSSSDVYSLGIILFELCYPMHTGMERMRVFEGIRRKNFVFPEKWHLNVAKQFPSVHCLLLSMLSHDPKERPSASEVAADIESLLSEYTVLSLDQSSIMVDGVIFVRVETDDTEGSLARTIKIIKDLSPVIHIHQYGLRVKGCKKIMEFALSIASDATNGGVTIEEHLRCLFAKLEAVDDIKNVRQIIDTIELSENRRKQSV